MAEKSNSTTAAKQLNLSKEDLQAIRKYDAICDTRPEHEDGVNFQKCPNCGEMNPCDFEECPNCGEVLNDCE